MIDLTNRQAEVLDFIKEYRNSTGNSPTYREIGVHFGFRSPKAAVDHVHALEKKGQVRIHGGRARGIELLAVDNLARDRAITVPVLGDIPAGRAEAQTEYQHGSVVVDQAILSGGPNRRLFAIRVHGESMEGRFIHDGDLVIVDGDGQPKEGDIVAALIDGENTLKTLAKHEGGFFLKSENPNYPDLIPYDTMVIQGLVRVVVRQVA